MESKREYRKVVFDRKLDVKGLRAALSKTMKVVSANPLAKAATARVESILVESNKTTVVLSGNGDGLNAASSALQSHFTYAKISKATKNVVLRPPRSGVTKR